MVEISSRICHGFGGKVLRSGLIFTLVVEGLYSIAITRNVIDCAMITE